MRGYTYILFDWDGTIAKTLDIWSDALGSALKKRGHASADEGVGANYELFREQYRHLGGAEVERLIEEALSLSSQRLPLVELYPDQLETLTLLHHANKHLGLVTTSEHRIIDPLLKKYAMAELSGTVVCGDDVTRQKPHPDPVIKAMESLAAKKSQTVMVGDSDKDIISAHNAGVDSILFYPSRHKQFHNIQHLKSLKPTYVVESFQEIIDIVR